MPDLGGKAGLSMQNIFIGSIIKQRRKELKLTQERLCDGICDPVSLSRIENGKQMPSRSIMKALLQRLGLPDTRYYALSSRHELEIEALEKEIVGCNALERVDEGFDKIAQLEKIIDPSDQITKQFVLRSKVLLGLLDGRYSKQESLTMLLDALRLTVPSFELDEINSHLYTVDEIKIINQIACTYSESGENEKATDIYYQLLKYVEKHFKEVIISSGVLPLILYNYARVLDLQGRYKDGKNYAREGHEACIKYGNYQLLHGCLAIDAECTHFLGDDRESAELYCQAYYICKAIGYTNDLLTIKKETKDYLGLTFQ